MAGRRTGTSPAATLTVRTGRVSEPSNPRDRTTVLAAHRTTGMETDTALALPCRVDATGSTASAPRRPGNRATNPVIDRHAGRSRAFLPTVSRSQTSRLKHVETTSSSRRPERARNQLFPAFLGNLFGRKGR